MYQSSLAIGVALAVGACAFSSPGGGGGDGAGDPDARGEGAGADGAIAPPDGRVAIPDATVLEGANGFPGDFPELIDSGGFGQGQTIQGFGGDDTTDRDGNRAQITHRPVVLVHGNGTHATDDTFGMVRVAEMLEGAGYARAELWAPSYLGQTVTVAETPTPTRSNIDDVRRSIDAVIDYLGVDRVDVIAHSLGCGMVNGYLRGLQPDGSFDSSDHRMDRVGTVVCLGGAVYGTGTNPLYEPEFNTAGAWVAESLTWQGVEDATPYGADDVGDMDAPATGQIPGGRPFAAVTTVDDGSRRIWWVALWATGDIVDGNLPGACGLGGADLNRGFDLPDSLPGILTAQLARHGHLLRSADVFAALLPYLDR